MKLLINSMIYLIDQWMPISLKALSMVQREVFLYVSLNLQDHIFNWRNNRIRLFITGNGGTRNSFRWYFVKNQVNRCYGKRVVKVCALRNWSGTTPDLRFDLTECSQVQKYGIILQVSMMAGIYLRQMRLQWRVEIWIVSYEMLCMSDSRLKQLINFEEYFGGINVIQFGNLMQLPPATGRRVFHYLITQHPQHIYGDCLL